MLPSEKHHVTSDDSEELVQVFEFINNYIHICVYTRDL